MALMKKGCKLDVLLGKKKSPKISPPYPPKNFITFGNFNLKMIWLPRPLDPPLQNRH